MPNIAQQADRREAFYVLLSTQLWRLQENVRDMTDLLRTYKACYGGLPAPIVVKLEQEADKLLGELQDARRMIPLCEDTYEFLHRNAEG